MVSSFNYFKMHAWSTCMLFLLHSSFMLSVVKILLKREVGGSALNSHGITSLIMKNHGIVFLNFCGNPVFCSLYGHIVCHEAIFEGPLVSSSFCLSIS